MTVPETSGETPVPQPRRFIGKRAAQERAALLGSSGSTLDGTAAPSDRADASGAEAGSQMVPRAQAGPKRFVRQQVPDEVLHDAALNQAIAVLPLNYNFEIHKSVWRLRQARAQRVALQFPEGLLMYSCIISDILETFAGVDQCFIMGDVTFGACCVDDFSAAALECDFLLHYGHSCLVPVDVTGVPAMYIFVDIGIDVHHLVETVRFNFTPGTQLSLAGTIQFASSIQAAKQALEVDFPSLSIPQSRPLSPGEVLGCTAPVLAPGTHSIVFVADGRFHLEAIMIANPSIPAYRYDPYERKMTIESYDQVGMRAVRRRAVEAATPARRWGLVLGTLGRQGNPRILEHLREVMGRKGLQYTIVLLSEITPTKLAMMRGVDAWCQVACPRLSIDWGEAFLLPTLTPYEALIALGEVEPWWKGADTKPSSAIPSSVHSAPAESSANVQSQALGTVESEGISQTLGLSVKGEEETPEIDAYPMDYYSRDGGVWGSTYHRKAAGGAGAAKLAALRAAQAGSLVS